MALDVFVMPLCRYKVGDFCSPIEAATGIRPKIVTSDGIEERPSKVSWLERWKARREVKSICKAVDRANHTCIRWYDKGGVVYSQQSRGFEPLRAFAKWLDCRDQYPEFCSPPEGDYYKHPVFAADIGQLSCSHLVNHDCYCGYFLPCEFGSMVKVEPYLIFGRWPSCRSVGSSPQLLRELETVQKELRIPPDFSYPSDDPLLDVKAAYLQLRQIAELSCQHGLPVIFWG